MNHSNEHPTERNTDMGIQTITVQNEAQARLLDHLRYISAHANDAAHALAKQATGTDLTQLEAKTLYLSSKRDTYKRLAVDMGIDPADVAALANGAWNTAGEWVHIEIAD